MRFTLNGVATDVVAPPMARLLDVLREECRLTGAKEGCGEGECGACTVLVDGDAVCSCLVPFAQVEGATVTTIEGLGGRHPLQRAFMDEIGAQCGICTPGMILTALTLGRRPSRAKIRAGLAGNLCRCTGYEAIYRAIQRVQ
jgi:aerobic-type carbon monoxide dehydrogenase small subunit (CoxS/CutS family)